MKAPEVQTPLQIKVREKNRVALTSIGAAFLLTGMKLGVGLWTGSLGILSEAAHSGLDLVAAVITYLAVRVSDRPPDRWHNFGHHKVENLSALVETLLLLLTCVWILYEAWHRLNVGYTDVQVNVFSFAVIGISIVVDYGRSRALMRVAKKYKSQALEADALHFSTDMYSSAVVIVGLVCVTYGFPEGDAIAAAMVAFIVIGISFRLGKRTIDVLLDRMPAGVREDIRPAVLAIDGVETVRSLRIREAGSKMFIDLVIGIERAATFNEAHEIMDNVEDAIHAIEPQADIMVHSEPVIGKDERLSDSLSWVIQRKGLRPHNIVILRENSRDYVHLDIEFPRGTEFQEAHEISSKLEASIRDYLPDIGDVVIHLEEARLEVQESQEVTALEALLISKIRDMVEADGDVAACRSVRCHATERGLKIALECSLDKGLTLESTHDITDRLETAITLLDPRILKVFIHAEPV